MTSIKKELVKVLGVGVVDAYSRNVYKFDKAVGRSVKTGDKIFDPASLYITTQNDWVDLTIDEAEKLIKVLKRKIKEANKSTTEALKGDK